MSGRLVWDEELRKCVEDLFLWMIVEDGRKIGREVDAFRADRIVEVCTGQLDRKVNFGEYLRLEACRDNMDLKKLHTCFDNRLLLTPCLGWLARLPRRSRSLSQNINLGRERLR